MIREGVVLAGGFGTRLRSVVSDLPKPMAPINGKPFLEYLLVYLNSQGIKKVVLSVGYMKDKIIDYFGSNFKDMQILYSVEEEPLGTGGAIKHSMKLLGDNFFVFNGDTIFMIDLYKMYDLFVKKQAQLVMGIKHLDDCSRYGSVEIDSVGRVVGFSEKKAKKSCLINGGVYIVSRKILSDVNINSPFSWEREFLSKYYEKYEFYGFISDGYFIDIGVPEEYMKAQYEFKRYF